MMSVCLVLSVARSNLHVRHHRADDWQDDHSSRTPAHDEALLADIRRHIAQLPTHGYRELQLYSIARGAPKAKRP